MKDSQKVLLASYIKNNKLNPENLFEVLEATGNPDVAIDVLLGTFQMPEISAQSKPRYGSDAIAQFERYDKYTDTIHYEYVGDRFESFYVPKETDESILTIDNIDQYKMEYQIGVTKSVYINTREGKTFKDQCSLERWSEKAVTPEPDEQ